MKPPPRLHFIHAGCADVAAIFRRGPSKQVELVRWNTGTDAFERGHWFHGRIYERRCDLSPDGELLVYFAAKFNESTFDPEYTYAWTAVSRLPWLTALALWPKGDCWHGGGLFVGPRQLLLNHRPAQAKPHPRHLPSGLDMVANPEANGEDDPIYVRRLARHGWLLEQDWVVERCGLDVGFRTDRARVQRHAHPFLPFSIIMERRIDGYRAKESFCVEGTPLRTELPEGRLDWVDWDRRGRLLVLHTGRVEVAEAGEGGVGTLRTLIDLTPDAPVDREAPPVALQW